MKTFSLALLLLHAYSASGHAAPPAPTSLALLVSLTGDDKQGDGSSEHPFRTLTEASKHARPGSRILLRGGTYPKARETLTVKGTAGSPITVAAYPGEKAILDGKDAGPRAVIEAEDKSKIVSVLDLRHSHHVIVEGLEVANSEGFGISTWDSENIVVRKCKIRDTWSRALGGSGAHLLFEDNEITGAVQMNAWEKVLDDHKKGIQSYWACATDTFFREDGSPSQDVTWRRNKVSFSWGEGIDANHVDGAVIEDNEIHDTYSVLIYVDHSRNVKVRRNFIYTTSGYYYQGNRSNALRAFSSLRSTTTNPSPWPSRTSRSPTTSSSIPKSASVTGGIPRTPTGPISIAI